MLDKLKVQYEEHETAAKRQAAAVHKDEDEEVREL
jgi:hypothetical protein